MSRTPKLALTPRMLPIALFVAAALLLAPQAFGVSSGITKDNAGVPDFEEIGCTSCHGANHQFTAGASLVDWTMTDAAGEELAGNAYEPDATYTITITLDETNAPGKAQHAGFNLRATAGAFEAVEGSSQISTDGSQATHVNADSVTWMVTWIAPAEGVAVFDLFVNDVDGNGAPNEGDLVYRVGWFLTDESHELPGAAVEEEHQEFGISLQQYWIGLIALAGMIFIMAAGYVYLKYASPHNSDAKDR